MRKEENSGATKKIFKMTVYLGNFAGLEEISIFFDAIALSHRSGSPGQGLCDSTSHLIQSVVFSSCLV